MELLINEKNKNSAGVVYRITLTSATDTKYYIGKTTRQLKKRVYEHLNNNKSQVCKYLENNNIDTIKIDILERCYFKQLLDIKETKAIIRHLLKHGKKNSKLLNKDLKGLEKMSVKDLQVLDSVI